MAEHTEAILKQALLLSPKSRAVLIEGLLASLDRPDLTMQIISRGCNQRK